MHRSTQPPELLDAWLPPRIGRNGLERLFDPAGRSGGRPACRAPGAAEIRLMVKVLLPAVVPSLGSGHRRGVVNVCRSGASWAPGTAGSLDDQPLPRRPGAGGARLFAAVEQQLAARGVLVQQGTLVDATLVDAQVRRPRGGKTGDGSPNGTRRARRGRHARFGYKVHLGVDADSEVRRARLTPANVNETEVADELIAGDEGAVYRPMARTRAARLQALGIEDHLMRRNKHHPRLSPAARRRHARIERVRRPVAHLHVETLLRLQRVRYRGVARNATEIGSVARLQPAPRGPAAADAPA